MKKHIPNALTCCNLISGGVATLFAAWGQADWALLFIVTGAVFDFFDGFAARLLGVQSPIGRELDSLADDITFGLAPATIAYTLMASAALPAWLAPAADYLPFTAFLMAAFAALRLAKFNLDTRQASSFIGLPTPANALFWGALACSLPSEVMAWGSGSLLLFPLLLVLVLLSCWLMVAEIPMFALKFKSFKPQANKLRYSFLLIALALIVLFGVGGLALAIVLYVALSLLFCRNPHKAEC